MKISKYCTHEKARETGNCNFSLYNYLNTYLYGRALLLYHLTLQSYPSDENSEYKNKGSVQTDFHFTDAIY